MTSSPPPNSSWPILRTEARSLGVTDRALRSSKFRTILPGVVVSSIVPDTVVVRARAAILLAPDGGVISHFTAARLWGGRVPDNEWTHVSFMRDVRFRVRGIRPHRYRRRLDVRKWHGVPVTSPEQTFCDMARFLGLVDLVALGDSLVRKSRLSPEHLSSYAEGWSGQFKADAVAAARLVRARVDSSPETALRLLLVLAGLPEPDIDIHIRAVDGTLRFRIELGYENVRFAIEYDGRWHEGAAQREKDRARRTHLSEEEGWTFVVVTGDELYNATETLLVRIVDAARSAGVPVPDRLSDGWRQHFRVINVAA
ncbi:hypothetical protein [Oryzobacter terrae]|uniref:hypothetical protein n=1 Tax=Oryzobacter terrae TaxID=1620385 RepID=UPI003671FE5D